MECYQLAWFNKDGKEHVEFFCTRDFARQEWGPVCGELSFVHIWIKPLDGLRSYLQQLPLDLVTIVKI